MQILKKIKTIHYFITVQPEMKKFILVNKKFWDNSKMKSCTFSLVESLANIPTHVNSVSRVAKIIEEEEGIKPIVLVNNYMKLLYSYSKVYESYGISQFIFFRLSSFSPILFIKSLYKSIIMYSQLIKGSDLLNIEMDGISFGELVYDSFIRNEENIYTVPKDLRLIKYLKKGFSYYYLYKKIFKKYNFSYYITGDKEYIEYGIPSQIAVNNGIKTIVVGGPRVSIYNSSNIRTNTFHPNMMKSEILSKLDHSFNVKLVDDILDVRMNGQSKQQDAMNAYNNKKIYKRVELVQELCLDPSKKNAIIMPHAFSDSPHCSERMLFNDYYDWFSQLLEHAEHNDSVNWILKPHPSSYYFNEDGFVEKYLQDKMYKNIVITPPNMSTASIKNVADVILTVRGTAGLEFSCFGVPALLAGSGYYTGYGFTKESNSQKEYFEQIEKIDTIQKLTEQEIFDAKLIFYWVYVFSTVDDEFPDLFVTPADVLNFDSRLKVSEENFKFLINKRNDFDPHTSNFYKYVMDLLYSN